MVGAQNFAMSISRLRASARKTFDSTVGTIPYLYLFRASENDGVKDAAARQGQAAALEDATTLSGATVAANRARILELIKGDPLNLNTMRDDVGGACIHMCFLFPDEEKRKLCRWLLSLHPPLIEAIYENTPKGASQYHGENCLHMAIANNFPVSDIEWLLSEAPSLVYGKADGSFFRPAAKGEVACAWGEYPLNFAVALNRPDIVRLLVQRGGADMLAKDTDGNTCMHVAVLHKRVDMVDVLEALWEWVQERRKEEYRRHKSRLPPLPQPEGAFAPAKTYALDHVGLDHRLDQETNDDNHTPLVLAAKIGALDMFKKLWERNRKQAWKFAHVTSWKYPLEQIDDAWDLIMAAEEEKEESAHSGGATLQHHKGMSNRGKPPARTALQLLTDGGFQEDTVIVDQLPVLRRLLDRKWASYAGAIFKRRLAIAILYLAVFAATVVVRGQAKAAPGTTYDRVPVALEAYGAGHFAACSTGTVPGGPFDSSEWYLALPAHLFASLGVTNTAGAACYSVVTGEVIIFVGALAKMAYSLMELRTVGLRYFFQAKGATQWERVSSIAACGFLFATAAAEAHGADFWARYMLVFASIAAYGYLLWFLLGYQMTGPFVVMLGKMLAADLLRFLSIAVVLLLGFSQAFFVELSLVGPMGLWKAIMHVFSSMVGGELNFGNGEGGAGEASVAGSAAAGASASSPYSTVSALSIIYILLANVMLLNLLVAMMGDTYGDVKGKAGAQWALERARIILQIEAGMSRKERLSERCKYWELQSNGHPFFQHEDQEEETFRASNNDAMVKEVALAIKAEVEAAKEAKQPLGATLSPTSAGAGLGMGQGTPIPTSGRGPSTGAGAMPVAPAAGAEAAAVARPRRRRGSAAAR